MSSTRGLGVNDTSKTTPTKWISSRDAGGIVQCHYPTVFTRSHETQQRDSLDFGEKRRTYVINNNHSRIIYTRGDNKSSKYYTPCFTDIHPALYEQQRARLSWEIAPWQLKLQDGFPARHCKQHTRWSKKIPEPTGTHAANTIVMDGQAHVRHANFEQLKYSPWLWTDRRCTNVLCYMYQPISSIHIVWSEFTLFSMLPCECVSFGINGNHAAGIVSRSCT